MSQVIEVDECVATLFDTKRLILSCERYLQIANKYKNFERKIELTNAIKTRNFKLVFNIIDEYYKKCEEQVYTLYELIDDLKNISNGYFPIDLIEKCNEHLNHLEQTQLPKLKNNYNEILNYIQTNDLNSDDFAFRKQPNEQNQMIFDLFKSFKQNYPKWSEYISIFKSPGDFQNEQIHKQQFVIVLDYLYELVTDYNLKNWIIGYKHLAIDDNQIFINHLTTPWKHKFILKINNNIYDSNLSIVDIIDKNYTILEQITMTVE